MLTLGRDIGVVMAKGVALGVVCTIVILPALILFFDKWVEKYRHRTFIPKLTRLSHFVSGHPVGVLIASIAIIIPFALAQGRTSVYYALFDALPQDMPGIVGVSKLGEDFGMVTNHFILVHDDLPASKVSALCDDIGELDGIHPGGQSGCHHRPGLPHRDSAGRHSGNFAERRLQADPGQRCLQGRLRRRERAGGADDRPRQSGGPRRALSPARAP